jgi:chaperone modulatory protein CbpM
MNRQLDESSGQDGGEPYPLEYLAEVSGLSIEEIEDLVTIGVIAPSAMSAQSRIFRLCHVLVVKKARRLRDDFHLDHHGVALALTLLQHIEELRSEVRALRSGRDR